MTDCLMNIPHLMEYVAELGLPQNFVRGKIVVQERQGPPWSSEIQLSLHPGPTNERAIEAIKIDAKGIERVAIKQIGSGFQVTLKADSVNGGIPLSMPPATMMNTEEWRMWPSDQPVNEFGYYYCALFLAGNYARYYPDKWIYDVESSAPLALAVEELCNQADWRVPWLTCSELSHTLYVPEV